jgi:hypothetical protein
MKNIYSLVSAGILCLTATVALAVNNADVVKMTKAGLDESTVLAAVRGANPAEFDTSADALIKLKEAGVSETIIQAMLARQNGGAAPGPSATAATIKYNKVEDSKVLPPQTNVVEGKEYYVRYTFKHEKSAHNATNYWRGDLVPINTKVVLQKLKKNDFTLKLVESGATVKVVNEKDYTKRDTAQLAREMLSEQPTAIESYGPEMAEAIRTGTLRLGMTKTQVLLARGYPPSHETPTLDAGAWKYWSSRFVTMTLAFDGNILREGRGLY